MSFNTTVSGVTVSYELYMTVMGRMPRGYGRWFFSFGNEDEAFALIGMFSQVKKEAARLARAAGHSRVKVQP